MATPAQIRAKRTGWSLKKLIGLLDHKVGARRLAGTVRARTSLRGRRLTESGAGGAGEAPPASLRSRAGDDVREPAAPGRAGGTVDQLHVELVRVVAGERRVVRRSDRRDDGDADVGTSHRVRQDVGGPSRVVR